MEMGRLGRFSSSEGTDFYLLTSVKMENSGKEEEFYDLSGALDGVELRSAERGGGRLTGKDNTPGIYGVVFRVSGGKVKTKEQARVIIVILLIIINAVTYILVSGKNGMI